MNELLFFLQIAFIIFFVWMARKWGKEALTAFMATAALLANIFVLKQMDWFSLKVTCSDAFFIGSLISLNLLREKFGKETAMKATWISFASLIFFAGACAIHLFFTPLSNSVQQAYEIIFWPQLRLSLASLTTFLLVQQLDVRLFHWIKQVTSLSFTWRNLICLLISQAFDTALFTALGLLGHIESFIDVVLMSFAVKAAAIFAGSLLIPTEAKKA